MTWRGSYRSAALSRNDLKHQAQTFADELTELLLATVCDGIRLSCVLRPEAGEAVIGFGIKRTDAVPRRAIPLTLSRRKARLGLNLFYRMCLDDRGQFLTVMESFAGLEVNLDDGRVAQLLHYDYERNKTGYTKAHVQIHAESKAWDAALPPDKPLAKLHLPVGGVRYRPTLEDLIELIGDHGLAVMRGGSGPDASWRKKVELGRRGFWDRQLRAAVHRRPGIAAEVLLADGLITAEDAQRIRQAEVVD